MKRTISEKKNIALVAHDNRKQDLLDWSKANRQALKNHGLHATGTTGKMLEKELGLTINKFMSGPLGGDFQIGSCIVEGKIDMLVFFWDPLESMAHDPDVKALLRLATMWNIPMACNEASADFFIQSGLLEKQYVRNLRSIGDYTATR